MLENDVTLRPEVELLFKSKKKLRSTGNEFNDCV